MKPARSKVSKDRPAEIALRIVLQQPPAGVDFALQKGRGSAYETWPHEIAMIVLTDFRVVSQRDGVSCN